MLMQSAFFKSDSDGHMMGSVFAVIDNQQNQVTVWFGRYNNVKTILILTFFRGEF